MGRAGVASNIAVSSVLGLHRRRHVMFEFCGWNTASCSSLPIIVIPAANLSVLLSLLDQLLAYLSLTSIQFALGVDFIRSSGVPSCFLNACLAPYH